MAKKRRETKWHKKQVSTRWGLAILSFLLLVTIILIPVLGQEQLSFIDAAGLSKADQAIVNKHLSCSVGSLKGVCKQVNGGSGFYVPGHCPGSSAVQCYISSASCSTPVGKGTCHMTSASAGSGVFIPGYCPGPSNVQCLVPNATIQANTSASCKSQKISGHATPTCEKNGTHASGGKYYTGFCPGPSNIKCWVPGATSSKTAGGSGGGTSSGGGGGTGTGTGSGGGTTCASIGGSCQSTSAHTNGVGGSYHAGLCPGGSNIQCWVPSSGGGGGSSNPCASVGNGYHYCSTVKKCFPASSSCPPAPQPPACPVRGVVCAANCSYKVYDQYGCSCYDKCPNKNN